MINSGVYLLADSAAGNEVNDEKIQKLDSALNESKCLSEEEKELEELRLELIQVRNVLLLVFLSTSLS